jgi:hypothetical protein
MSATRGLHHPLGDVAKLPDVRDAAAAVLLHDDRHDKMVRLIALTV